MSESKIFTHSPYVPYEPTARFFQVEGWLGDPFAHALEYNGWEPEQLSWKTSAYLCGALNPNLGYRLTGTQVVEFLRSVSVNALKNFTPGSARHVILTDESGRIMMHGMVLRESEESFVSYFLAPYLDYLLSLRPDLDVRGEYVAATTFLFQIGGPRSLEIVEEAAGENLHDIAFLHHREATIAGHDVRVLRLGMAGTLSYEVHGPIEGAEDVFRALQAAGAPFGVEILGVKSYMSNHTENGFPQIQYHFPPAWATHPGLLDWFQQSFGFTPPAINFEGSETDVERRYRNPYDVGWGHMVKFDHDFIGRAALEAIADHHNEMRTLVWNPDDIAVVHRSAYEDGEPYLQFDMPVHLLNKTGDPEQRQTVWADKVLVDGRQVGTSSGRAYSLWSKEMLSLATLDPEFAEIGTEVTVLWGRPGTRQAEIRARVERFPYLIDPVRNEVFDVDTIPSRFEPSVRD